MNACIHCGVPTVPDARASSGVAAASPEPGESPYFCAAHSDTAQPGDPSALAHEHEVRA